MMVWTYIISLDTERRNNMFFANLLAMLGIGAANAGSQACLFWVIDEAECPESLIK